MESHKDGRLSVDLRYFPLKEGYAYAQISTKFSGYEYQKLSGVKPG
jgi:hypothetical protein